jgi:dTDP-glucose pyrophosphorylase
LKEYTTDIPKHIIAVAGKPFIYYLLDAVVEAGYRRIFVVGGYHIDKLKKCLLEYTTEAEIILVDQIQLLGEQCYGTTCPVLAVKDKIQGDRFVYTMGDQLLSVADLQAMQQSTADTLVAVTEHNNPERYGVIEYKSDHTLSRIIEKPSHPISHDINVGLYTLTKDIFPLLDKTASSNRGESELTDVINTLARDHTVRVVNLQQPWLDLGRPEDITALERYLKP